MESLFKKFLIVRQMDYLIIDSDFIILETSQGISRFAECPEDVQPGQDVRLSFPELFGTEEMMLALMNQEQDYFEFNAISRVQNDQSIIYLNIYFISSSLVEHPKPRLTLFFEDVTQRMNLEQALVQETNESRLLLNAYSRSQQYIDKIITSMEDSLIVTNQRGIIKKVNPAAANLLGYIPEELINQPMSVIVRNDSYFKSLFDENLILNNDFLHKNVEVTSYKKNKGKITLEFSISTIYNETEDSQNLIFVGRDITNRKRSQQQMFAQYIISQILSESATIYQAFPKILAALCESLEWLMGEVWMIKGMESKTLVIQEPRQPELTFSEDDTPQLHCLEIWGKPSLELQEFKTLTQQMTLTPQVDLPGHILSTGCALWVENLAHDSRSVRHEILAKLKLNTGFYIPIQDSKEVLGVMSFYSQEFIAQDNEILETMASIGSQIGQFIKRKQAELSFQKQQQQTEQLLLNILPEPIANRLKRESKTIAEHFTEVTVLFADIVGFTQISETLSPIDLVNLLSQLFSTFDHLTEKYKLEKIKTIGDAYMVVGGLPKHRDDHAIAIANIALDMLTAITLFNLNHHQALSLRIGIHSGPVVAGVIGIKKFLYDLWGDTVNIASRMESHGLAGRIQMSEATYKLLPDSYIVAKRGTIKVKGKGSMNTYFLLGRKGEVTLSRLNMNALTENPPQQFVTQCIVEMLHNKIKGSPFADELEVD